MTNNSVKKEFKLLHRRHNTLQLFEKVNYTYTYYTIMLFWERAKSVLGEG